MITFAPASRAEVDASAEAMVVSMEQDGSAPARIADAARRMVSNTALQAIKGVNADGDTVLFLFGATNGNGLFVMAGGVFIEDQRGSKSYYYDRSTHQNLQDYLFSQGYNQVKTTYVQGTPIAVAFLSTVQAQNSDLYPNLNTDFGANGHIYATWDTR